MLDRFLVLMVGLLSAALVCPASALAQDSPTHHVGYLFPAPVPGWKLPALPYWLSSLQMNSIRSPAPVCRSGRSSLDVNFNRTGRDKAPGSSSVTSLTSVP